MTDASRIYRDLAIGRWIDVLWYLFVGGLLGSGIYEVAKVILTGRIL